MSSDLMRYSVIPVKNPREIVLLRGSGCVWRKCRFCNYHLDFSNDEKENFSINRQALSNVTGNYGKLEVINSGSYSELDENTKRLILQTCKEKSIHTLHFESHWSLREDAAKEKEYLESKGICVKRKIGVETFDVSMREKQFVKGIDTDRPEEIAAYFEEVCLLFGIKGQTLSSMEYDVETALHYFERVCINIMVENGMPVKPDPTVIALFCRQIYPRYQDNPRVDILMENTEFGVG